MRSFTPAESKAILASSWPITAAAKTGSYMSLRDMDIKGRIEFYRLLQRMDGDVQLLAPKSWHITTCYSLNVTLPEEAQELCERNPVTVTIDNLHIWQDHKGRSMLVALIKPGICEELNAKWLANGAVHTYDPYSAHISLAYGAETIPEKMLKGANEQLAKYPLHLTFARETLEPLD